jgi:hypothetical protein|tara:strand:- start:5231 stop:9847 length:4617 start_codon:yes stop_codon:yes gene_type:complete
MAIINIGGDPSSRLKLGYTLDDLEKNEEFQNVAERFLGSLGEKDNDVFEYLRDSDFNLFSGFQRMSQSEKFTEQQKQDYKYLRSRFDRADMGSFKQYAELIKDATVDIATDPTAIAAMLLTPVTGGTSLAARTAGAKSLTNGMKNIALSADKAKGISPAGTVGITAAEVGAWTGLDNHFRQNTELNADMRRIYSTPELVSSTAIGALTGGIFGGLARKNDFFAERMAKLYTNDGYRKDAGSDLVYNLRKAKDKLLAKTLASPAWILKTDADFSKTARELGVRFTPEFGKKLTRQTRRRVGYSYAEDVNFDRGNYKLLFDNAIAPIRKTGEVLPADSKAVLTLLRGGEVTNANKAVRETADNLREFFNKVLNDAEQVGLEPNKVENYFPRSWDREAIEANPEKFRQLLTKTRKDADGKEFQIVKPKDVDEVVEGMLNKQNELYSSSSTLITQARKFRNLDDNEFSEFLNNDLVPVVTDYFMGAARTINHKKHFLSLGKDVSARRTEKGNLMLFKQSNEQQFINRFIKPIDDELRAARGKGLTKNQKKDILKVYESVTGQVDYFDSGVIQGIYDGTKLANAMAYLPLATLSSLSEAFITLGKAPTSSAIKGMQSTIDNGHNFFTKELGQLIKEKHQMPDSELVKEMNSVFLAVDESLADVTNRLAGEGLQNETLKRIARGFYRFNVLIPWTKTVQLAAFSTGKDMITQNLAKLASPAGLSSRATQRLRGELNDLGVDIDKGLAWHNKHNGKFNKASLNDEFYKNDIVRGAGRFTNSVILQTSREYATVPTFMTNPKWDILTQFLRYPTVFSNTVLRNFAKETITDTRANAPKLAAFVVMATNLAKATNYWRSSPEERERIDTEGRDYLDTLKAFQRVGLLGPLEYGLRIGEAISYGQNPIAATGAVGGPIINDIVGLTLYNRGLLETAARKAPLIGTRNIFDRAVGDIMEEYTGFREPYTPLQKAAKEADKAIGGGFERGLVSLLQREEEDVDNITDRRILKNTGGLVSSRDLYTGQPLDVNVQYTKEDPADRINPMTGEPYRENFVVGGIAGKLAKRLTKAGFDTDKPLYHGSENVFDEFDPTKIGQKDKGFYGKGFYFTPLKREAELYGPNVEEYFVKGKMLDLEGGSELQRVFDKKAFEESQMENAFDTYKLWASKLDKIDALPPAQKLAYKDFLKVEKYFKDNLKLTKTYKDKYGNQRYDASIKMPDSSVIKESDSFDDASELFERYLRDIDNTTDESGTKYLFPYLKNVETRLSMVMRDLDDLEYNEGIEDVAEFVASKVKKAGFSGIRAGSETVVFDPKNIIKNSSKLTEEQMSRLGFAIGGIVSKVAQQLTKSQKKNIVDGDYVYHFTSKANAEKIKNEGLNPLKTSNFVKAGTGERYQASPAVYAFKNPADAVAFAKKHYWRGDDFEKLALIKIRKGNYKWEPDQAPDIESLFGPEGLEKLNIKFDKREVRDFATDKILDTYDEYLPSIKFSGGVIKSRDIVDVKSMTDIEKAFKDPTEFRAYSTHNENWPNVEGNPYGFAKIIDDVFENKR